MVGLFMVHRLVVIFVFGAMVSVNMQAMDGDLSPKDFSKRPDLANSGTVPIEILEADDQEDMPEDPEDGGIIADGQAVFEGESRIKENLNALDEDGETALTKAVKSGDQETVQRLIQAGADVNAWNAAKKTSLRLAVEGNDRVDIACMLARAGAKASKRLNIEVVVQGDLKEEEAEERLERNEGQAQVVEEPVELDPSTPTQPSLSQNPTHSFLRSPISISTVVAGSLGLAALLAAVYVWCHYGPQRGAAE